MGQDLGSLRLADLELVQTVIRHASISSAARELKVTPSHISKVVSRVERHLHTVLLRRTPQGIAPSDQARLLGPRLDDIVQRVRGLGAEHDETAMLTVAAPSYLNARFLPVIAQAVGPMRVRGLELPPSLLRAYSSSGLFDMALTVEGAGRDPFPATWVHSEAGSLRWGLFAPPLLAQRFGHTPVAPSALTKIPFVVPVFVSQGQLVAVHDGCPLALKDRRRGHEAQTIALALDMAAASAQLVFGPLLAAHQHLVSGALVEVPVAGWNVEQRLHVVCNGEGVLARVRNSVVKALTKALGGTQA
jgi:DNA-binding transcriptional LysR family regulator